MYCGKCGNKLIEDARFCAVCGAPIPTHLQGRGTSRYYDHPERQSSSNPREVHNPQFQPKNTPKTDSRAQGMYQAGNGTDRICPVCGRTVPWNIAGCVCGYPYRINKSADTFSVTREDVITIRQKTEQPTAVPETKVSYEPEQPVYVQEMSEPEEPEQPEYIQDTQEIEEPEQPVYVQEIREAEEPEQSEQPEYIQDTQEIEEPEQPVYVHEMSEPEEPEQPEYIQDTQKIEEPEQPVYVQEIREAEEPEEPEQPVYVQGMPEPEQPGYAWETREQEENPNIYQPTISYAESDDICPYCGRKVDQYASYCICGYIFNKEGVNHFNSETESALSETEFYYSYTKPQKVLFGSENEHPRFCQVCGKPLASDERFCERCGTAADISDRSEVSYVSTSPNVSNTEENAAAAENRFQHISIPEEEDKDRAAQVIKAYHRIDPNSPLHPYKKLGGFLMYDVVARIIALLLEVGIGVFELVVYNEYRYLWRWLLSFLPRGQSELVTAVLVTLNALIIIFTIMDLVQVILILCRSKWFLLFYQLTYVLALLAGATMVVLTIVMFSQYTRFNYAFSGILPYAVDFIRLIITFILWSHYYSHSVRVRVYMGSSEYLRKSLFNRRTKSPAPEFDENGYEIG